jgi:dimethylamine--corrinoid protein Co-methyltransferase
MGKIYTKLGDGSVTELSESELKRDLEEATRDAAERAKIPPLSEDELSYLFDIYSSATRFMGVDCGNEVVLTYDNGGCKSRGHVMEVPLHKVQEAQIYEKFLGADSADLGHIDYSFKPVKAVVDFEQRSLEYALLVMTIPVFYGSQPNLGSYTQPDGPCPNPMELLPQGKISEARAAQEEIIEYATRDMVYVGSKMCESRADGINFDTAGAAGDSDFLATLRAVEILKREHPQIGIMLGMAGEFVLGMHGELTYNGVRLAGLYPHKQVELAEKAGATIFGPAITTNTTKSCAWSAARAITFVKACVENSNIPIHPNMGMGLAGVPVCATPPVDAVSRASKAMVEIGRIDGL